MAGEEKARKTLEQREEMSDLERLRHSCAHVMATAISRLWPDAEFAYGPPVDHEVYGFYYDLEMGHRLTPDDFEKIEAEMRKIVKENSPFERVTVSRDEALKFAHSGRLGAVSERPQASKFKVDLLQDIPEGEEISIFRSGDFWDLCAGPHVDRTGKCKAFKVMSVASAYYKGDASNAQLQRVYGNCFKNRTLLDEHLLRIEEAKKRDHRKLGRELELFRIDDQVGQGLVLWLPNGSVIRNELQLFIAAELEKQGYSQVFTPHIGKLDLYRTSGHFPYYQDSQFPPLVDREALKKLTDAGCSCGAMFNALEKGEEEGFLLKPMNCPHHIRIYDSKPRSYRDLPVRLAEFGTVYRWEQSGELGGMTRVRCFTQDDAHLFVTPDQLDQEIQGCLELVKTVLRTLQMEDYRVRVSLRDPDSSKYVGDPANWERAEEALRRAARYLGKPFTEEPGEAAFYGPKIDFVVKDVLGREWQLGTVQVDYNLPERFDLSYVGADNEKHRPIMIHRAPFGSMERFVGVLIEHFAGHFPTWLAPEQARVLPISEKFEGYGQEILGRLRELGVRATLDTSSEKVGAKIRLAQVAKIPYMLVVGAKEEEAREVSIRYRTEGDVGSLALDDFLQQIGTEIRNRLPGRAKG